VRGFPAPAAPSPGDPRPTDRPTRPLPLPRQQTARNCRARTRRTPRGERRIDQATLEPKRNWPGESADREIDRPTIVLSLSHKDSAWPLRCSPRDASPPRPGSELTLAFLAGRARVGFALRHECDHALAADTWRSPLAAHLDGLTKPVSAGYAHPERPRPLLLSIRSSVTARCCKRVIPRDAEGEVLSPRLDRAFVLPLPLVAEVSGRADSGLSEPGREST
jgi:hypothetical protein